MLKKWQNFLETLSLIEFPLKKYLSIIKSKLDIKEGVNKIRIDFGLTEHTDKVKVEIEINWNINSLDTISGGLDILKSIKTNFEIFYININIDSNKVDENLLLSTIQHELKHTYDILTDNSEEENTFQKIEPLNRLMKEFKVDKYYEFIHMVYESLKHELDARNASIYDRLRWLNNYDKSLISNEFEKTYIYKSLIRLGEFNHKEFINGFDEDELVKITNRFIEVYGGYDKVNTNSIVEFYKYWEVIFHKSSENYLKLSYRVIDEIIKDTMPYMDAKLTTEHPNLDRNDRYLSLFKELLYKNLV